MSSSANKEMVCYSPRGAIPVIPIFSASRSINNAKIKWDRGHPCLVPLVMENCSENSPSAKKCATRLKYKDDIASLIPPQKT